MKPSRNGMPHAGLTGVAILVLALSGCALFSTWHWEKLGATDADYEWDLKFCKQQSYSGADGMVTKESVRRMHACMEARGWRKMGS